MSILQMVELAHRGAGTPSMCKAPSTLYDGSSTLEAAYLLRTQTQGNMGRALGASVTQFKSQVSAQKTNTYTNT